MTDPLGLDPNNPPKPTGWKPVWFLSTTLPWPEPIEPTEEKDL